MKSPHRRIGLHTSTNENVTGAFDRAHCEFLSFAWPGSGRPAFPVAFSEQFR